MKTIKRTNPKTNELEYKRIDDSNASNMVRIGWEYVPKTEWKTNVRDFGKTKSEDSSSVDGEIYIKDKKNSKKHAKKNAKV
jgi:hypothetical protein